TGKDRSSLHQLAYEKQAGYTSVAWMSLHRYPRSNAFSLRITQSSTSGQPLPRARRGSKQCISTAALATAISRSKNQTHRRKAADLTQPPSIALELHLARKPAKKRLPAMQPDTAVN